MTDSYSTILVRSVSPHLRVYLNRPQKRNALNQKMVNELIHLLSWAKDNTEIRTLTLSGEGSAFCSGADLDYLKKLAGFDRRENEKDARNLADLYISLYAFPKPVIALVNGPAIAGGCGLATVCDMIIASDRSKFGYPEVKIGFVAALVSIFLIRQIGERKAKELLLTGRILTAEQAFAYGMINKIVPHESLNDELTRLYNELEMNSPTALKQTKELFTRFSYKPVQEIIETFCEINVRVRELPDFAEGISAFLEKRKPQWD